nr:unnamed protein product [Callosobruchus analis]
MQRGQFMFETKGKLSAVKWMDSKCVHVLSNYFCPKETATVLRRNKTGQRETIHCPKAIAEYNEIMEVSINSTNSTKDMLLDEDLQNGGIVFYTI